MGCSGLCSLINPLMDGAEGFIFMCLYLVSGGISVLISFITFLTCDWKDLVGLMLWLGSYLPYEICYFGIILFYG